MMEEYDDYYEEEGEEQYEEEDEQQYAEEQQEHKPTAEELEYLELRKRIKDQIRKRMHKDNSCSLSKSRDIKKHPTDNFGSFFGPSQPVIAQRVIQESKSLLENPHLAVRVANGSHRDKHSTPRAITSRNGMHQRLSSVKNEVQMKVQKLKDTRDYSFLLSDDTVVTAPSNEPKPRNLSASKSEVCRTQERIKQSSGRSSRNASSGHEEKRASIPNVKTHSRGGTSKISSSGKSNSAPVDFRRSLGNSTNKVPGRPAGREGFSSNTSVASEQKRSNVPSGKNSLPAMRRQPPPKMQSSVSNQRFEQRKPVQEHRPKVASKQPVASPKQPQIKKPAKQVPLHASKDETRPKRMLGRQLSDDEDEQALSLIRKMFNVQRYARRDDDDSDMEANFDDIMKEERMSEKIARKEDEEQLRLIEEEKRRERMRKLAKKRKLGH